MSCTPPTKRSNVPTARWARTLAMIAMLVATTQFAAEARVDFRPVIFLYGYGTNNITFASENEPKVADTTATAGVTLPVRRESRRGFFEFLYTTGYTKYRTQTVFDDFSHFAGLRYETQPNPKTTIDLNACFVSTQEQDVGIGTCTDLFISERTRRNLFGATFDFRRLLARRWSWSLGLEAASADFEPIEGFVPTGPGPLVEDKAGYLARTGIGRVFGKRLTFGATYSYSFVDQEISPGVTTHVARVNISHTVSRRFKYRLDVGWYSRTSDAVQDPSDGEFRNEGIEFLFELQYGETKGYEIGPVRLDLTAGVQPTAGGAIQGTSTNVFAGAALGPRRRSKWDWNVSGQYAVRLPTQRDLPDLTTVWGEFRVERSVIEQLGVRFRGIYRDQASEDPVQAISYYRVEFGLAWYPMGQRRPGPR